ncbi:MAG: ferritin-like domain-containing protein [Bacillota bacterium]|nr:ferritin-like domain-containing protein [Bacillota bacterium]
MELSTMQTLRTYIDGELKGNLTYSQLAKIAPFAEDRKILMSMAEDELKHANMFKNIYLKMFGRNYSPDITVEPISGDYYNNLREMVMDEGNDFRTYAHEYMNTRNEMLRNAYATAAVDENVHADRLLMLLSKEGEKPKSEENSDEKVHML